MPRLQEHEAAAFGAFVVARRGSLLRTALLLTGDRGRAEDLVQTALFETFRRWPRLRDQVDPVGYARKTLVTRRRCTPACTGPTGPWSPRPPWSTASPS